MARTRASDFDEKRHAILASAAAVFAEHGMDRTSMAQIAQHANMSKALLYHYYPSRDALIFGIVETHLASLEAAVIEADDKRLPAEERLAALVWAVLDTYRDKDDQHTVQLNGTATLSPSQKEAIRIVERRIVKRFADVLVEINPALGKKNKRFLMPTTMSLFGMLNWVYLWFRDGGAITRKEYGDLATRLILDGVKSVE